MNIKELRKKKTKELENELLKLLREKFNLRMQMGKRALQQTHLLKKVRRTIARVKTLLNSEKITKINKKDKDDENYHKCS